MDASLPGETISTAQLEAHVRQLAGVIGERNVATPSALAAAERYIASEWRRQGYAVHAQRYDARGVDCANLEVVRPARAEPAGTIVVGAHYDTVRGSPGADDNASGVAALLELSRLSASVSPGLELRFVAFVNEEPPFFMSRLQGSMVYASAARRRGDDIRLMLSLEMLGVYDDAPGSQRYPPLFRRFYPDRGNFLGLVSNFRSRRAMYRLADAYRAASRFPLEHVATFAFIPGVAWSDHLSFWRAGYRAVMVTDTAFYRYPHYHTPQDTPDRLDYRRFAEATQGLYHALVAIADCPRFP